jgi:hypothetical protein
VLDLSRGPIRLLPGIDLVETLSEERMKGLEPSTFCMASRAEGHDPRRPTTTNGSTHAGLRSSRAALSTWLHGRIY